MNSVFLGRPPQYVHDWITKTKWTRLVEQLESQSSSLPEVGSSLTVPYKVDPNGNPVDTEWMVLGYNKDIPRFVKYKNGNDRVYMDVLPGNQLLTTFEGANVYSNKDGTGLVGTVAATGGTSFTFGNNNTYSVPGRITVNGTNYTFCGYNVTLQSKYGLVAKFNDSLYECPQFDSQNRNDWKTSEIREWLNGTEAIPTQKWYNLDGSSTTGTITGILGRLTDTNFTGNIIPTVTRTWVHTDWRDGTEDGYGCQHLADRFRLLGEGDVNGSSSNFNDDQYDTSKFTDIFTYTTSRKRNYMNEDGTEGSACSWWVRSACSGNSYGVGYVGYGGLVGNYGADYGNAVLPVCLIG